MIIEVVEEVATQCPCAVSFLFSLLFSLFISILSHHSSSSPQRGLLCGATTNESVWIHRIPLCSWLCGSHNHLIISSNWLWGCLLGPKPAVHLTVVRMREGVKSEWNEKNNSTKLNEEREKEFAQMCSIKSTSSLQWRWSRAEGRGGIPLLRHKYVCMWCVAFSVFDNKTKLQDVTACKAFCDKSFTWKTSLTVLQESEDAQTIWNSVIVPMEMKLALDLIWGEMNNKSFQEPNPLEKVRVHVVQLVDDENSLRVNWFMDSFQHNILFDPNNQLKNDDDDAIENEQRKNKSVLIKQFNSICFHFFFWSTPSWRDRAKLDWWSKLQVVTVGEYSSVIKSQHLIFQPNAA